MYNEETLVSVIVPAYNAENTIDQTLLSVRKQSHRNLDIIVVDDGSTDQTFLLSSEHSRVDGRVRVLQQSNAGVAAARNLGIKEARGDFVAPIDADDLWRPTKIARQLRALRAAGSETTLAYSWSALIDGESKVIEWGDQPVHVGDVLLLLCGGNFVGNGSTALMRKSAVDECGGYDRSLRARNAQGCEDWRLFLQLAEGGHFAVVPDFLTGYRQAPGAMSRDIEQMLRSDALVRSEILQRYPEYLQNINRGRRLYMEWLFRRELQDDNWPTCLRLLRELVLTDDGKRASARRVTKFALRVMKCIVRRKPRSANAQYLQCDQLDPKDDASTRRSSVQGSAA